VTAGLRPVRLEICSLPFEAGSTPEILAALDADGMESFRASCALQPKNRLVAAAWQP
jgi:hypothetical protein